MTPFAHNLSVTVSGGGQRAPLSLPVTRFRLTRVKKELDTGDALAVPGANQVGGRQEIGYCSLIEALEQLWGSDV